MNKERVRDELGAIDNDDFEAIALTVARIRTLYLQQVIRLKDFTTAESLTNIDEMSELLVSLRRIRNGYEEAVAGFVAMQHAVERDYITIESSEHAAGNTAPIDKPE